MPLLDPIGKVAKPEEIDWDPITIPVVGYRHVDFEGVVTIEEVVTNIDFVNTPPPGFAINMIRATKADGTIDFAPAMMFLQGCIAESSVAEWNLLVFGNDVRVEKSTIGAIYEKLGEVYEGRPAKRRSGSGGGRSSTKPTSQGAASDKVSPKRRSAA